MKDLLRSAGRSGVLSKADAGSLEKIVTELASFLVNKNVSVSDLNASDARKLIFNAVNSLYSR